MVVSIEYLAVVGAMLVFVFQSIFTFGKMSGKVNALGENVFWIRDYILHCGADIKHFKQNSPIGFENEDDENLLSLEWKEKLKSLELKSRLSNNPLDIVVHLTNAIGLVECFEEAKTKNIDVNTLILSSAIFYNNFHQEE